MEALEAVLDDMIYKIRPSSIPTSAEAILKGIQADDQKSVIFCETVVQVILDRIPTTNSSKELEDLMSKFHELSLNVKTWDAWVSIGFNLSIDFEKDERDLTILLQAVLSNVQQLLLKKRNQSLNEDTIKEEDIKLSATEENTLRYVAGYIPFSLLKALGNRVESDGKDALVMILHSWNKEQTSTSVSFLDYTREWVDRINRGGLYQVNDEFYIFIRRLENCARKILNRSLLVSYAGEDSRSVLLQKFVNSRLVQLSWATLTKTLKTSLFEIS